MRDIELQFNFSKVSPDLVTRIEQAIHSNTTFGLTNGRVLNVFYPGDLRHSFKFINSDRRTLFGYDSAKKFTNAISLALLTCREFIVQDKLLAYDYRANQI